MTEPQGSIRELHEKSMGFSKVAFPDECVGVEPEGVCLVTVDASAAGCIDTSFAGRADVARRPGLDEWRTEVRRQCVVGLKNVLPHLDGSAALLSAAA